MAAYGGKIQYGRKYTLGIEAKYKLEFFSRAA